ncbi:MAG: hypothetical protein IIB17_04160, partial [Chloroflexi bacterium]|nr:hypothetical protein [Chloroflexota bacterium]
MVVERLSCICVLVAFSLSALGAAAQDLVYVGSNGEIVFVDSADPGRFGQPEVPTRALRGAGLSFNVAYDDVTTSTGFGFDDQAYYVTSNLFGLSAGGWAGVGFRVFDKTPLLTGQPAVYSTLRDGGSASAQVAQ